MVERHKPVYGEAITTPEFRVSYPTVFEPKPDMQNELFYNITMLFEKDADLSKIKAACTAIATELGWEKGKYKLPFEDGNIKYEENPQSYLAMKDMIVSKAKSKNKPGIVDRLKKEINHPNEFYGGCYARAQIVPKSYIMPGKKGITFQLQNIQKLRDGEPFGRAVPQAKDVFDAVEEAKDDDSFNVLD